MYNPTIVDHYQNPRNMKEMKNATAMGTGSSRTCGDSMALFLTLDKNVIKSASFTTIGCSAAIAGGSIITELLKGKTIDEAQKISPATLIEALGGVPTIKLQCVDLVVEALKSALNNFEKNSRKKPTKSPHP